MYEKEVSKKIWILQVNNSHKWSWRVNSYRFEGSVDKREQNANTGHFR